MKSGEKDVLVKSKETVNISCRINKDILQEICQSCLRS